MAVNGHPGAHIVRRRTQKRKARDQRGRQQQLASLYIHKQLLDIALAVAIGFRTSVRRRGCDQKVRVLSPCLLWQVRTKTEQVLFFLFCHTKRPIIQLKPGMPYSLYAL